MARLLRLPENRSALAACQDLLLCLTAKDGAELPNPLFLHGPPGSGKSLLIDALADELAAQQIDVCRRPPTISRSTQATALSPGKRR